MAIPSPNESGWLDFSTDPYPATLDEVYQAFVLYAPNQDVRIRPFDALSIHLVLLFAMGGPAPVWLSGGFVSHDPYAAPSIDLVYLCSDGAHLGQMLRTAGIFELVTMHTVFAEEPMMVSIPQLRPVAITARDREHAAIIQQAQIGRTVYFRVPAVRLEPGGYDIGQHSGPAGAAIRELVETLPVSADDNKSVDGILGAPRLMRQAIQDISGAAKLSPKGASN